jgi:hypothetical protein
MVIRVFGEVSSRRPVARNIATRWLIGVALLTLNVAGLVHQPAPPRPRTLTRAQAEGDLAALRRSRVDPRTKVEILAGLLPRYFEHEPAGPWPSENWVLWLVSRGSKRLRDVQSPSVLWRRGGGLCHQAATVFVSQCRRLGIPAVLVGLGNHVVAEAQLPTERCMVDPEIGRVWDHPMEDFGSAVSDESLVQVYEAAGAPAEEAMAKASDWCDQSDNFRHPWPLAPRLYGVERLCAALSWLIPIGLLLSAAARPFAVGRCRRHNGLVGVRL